MIRWLALGFSACLYGVAGEFIFRRLTNTVRLRKLLDRMIAHALELPLFFDEPGVVWRAQRALFRDNLKLLGMMAPPMLVIAAIFLAAYQPMDKFLGHRPLRAGESAVVTAPPPAGFVTETPGVHVARNSQVSWRVRALRPDADQFPYRGPRAPWILPFALLSTVAGLASRYIPARD